MDNPKEFVPRKLVEIERRVLRKISIQEEKKVIFMKAKGQYFENAQPSTIRQSKIETEIHGHILRIIEKETDASSILRSPVWRITKV